MKELKLLFEEHVNPEPLDDVNVVSSKQSTPSLSTPRKCFPCGSTSHLQRDCSRALPMRGRGRRQGRSYRSAPNSHFGKAQGSITCYNCGGVGHVASQCSSPRLN